MKKQTFLSLLCDSKTIPSALIWPTAILIMFLLPNPQALGDLQGDQSKTEPQFESKILKLIEASEFDKARRLTLEQGGPYSNEVTQARLDLLHKINEAETAARSLRIDQITQAREAAFAAAKTALAPLRAEIAKQLLAMNFEAALDALHIARASNQNDCEAILLGELQSLVAGIGEYPMAIAATFLNHKNTPITIATKDAKALNIIVTNVKKDGIVVRQHPQSEKTPEQTILIHDLATAEKLERLAQYKSDATLIARALIIHETGYHPLAIRLLQDSSAELAKDLVAAIRHDNQ